MALLLQDKEDYFLYSDNPVGISNRPRVTVRPNVKPFWELVGSQWVQDIDLLRIPPMDDNGNWSITLPWPSESNPSTVSWAIVRTDGTVVTGKIPEGVVGPVSLDDLIEGHSWGYGPRTVNLAPLLTGPRGINWKGAWSSSNQYGVGDAVYYQNNSYIAVHSNLLDTPPSLNWDLLVSVPSTYNALTFTSGTRITSGSGTPSTPGGANPTAGDVYIRVDTPNTSNQRIYVCVTGGASPVWVGIV